MRCQTRPSGYNPGAAGATPYWNVFVLYAGRQEVYS